MHLGAAAKNDDFRMKNLFNGFRSLFLLFSPLASDGGVECSRLTIVCLPVGGERRMGEESSIINFFVEEICISLRWQDSVLRHRQDPT